MSLQKVRYAPELGETGFHPIDSARTCDASNPASASAVVVHPRARYGRSICAISAGS